MNTCNICEAYRDNHVGLYCPRHEEEKFLDNYHKIVNWLYGKTDCSQFQKELRLYMFLKWASRYLKSLKFEI